MVYLFQNENKCPVFTSASLRSLASYVLYEAVWLDVSGLLKNGKGGKKSA